MKNQWILCLCMVLFYPAIAQETETLKTVNILDVWKQAPNTWLQTVGGQSISAESLKGKVIVLNFWFIGCKPCMKELPYLNDLYEKFKDNEAFVFLSIAPHGLDDIQKFINPNDTTFQAVRSYYKVPRGEAPIMYPIVAICEERSVVERKSLRPDCHEDLANTFSLKGYPLTLLIDRFGKVADIRDGYPIDEGNKPDFAEVIESLLSE